MDAELIEKVARAIYDANAEFQPGWDVTHPRYKDHARALARAAIAALSATTQPDGVSELRGIIERQQAMLWCLLSLHGGSAQVPDKLARERPAHARVHIAPGLNCTALWIDEPATPQAAQVPEGARELIEQCREALAEELGAWGIDPPLAHVKDAHDACEAWLAAAQAQGCAMTAALANYESIAEAHYSREAADQAQEPNT